MGVWTASSLTADQFRMAGSIADPLSAYCCLKAAGFSAQQFPGSHWTDP